MKLINKSNRGTAEVSEELAEQLIESGLWAKPEAATESEAE